MSRDEERDPVERLSAAYDTMAERVRDGLKRAEETTVPAFTEALREARERAVTLGELTREEADRLSGYLERDIHDAAEFIVETGQDFRDWFKFDWQLIEKRLFDTVAGVADQTSMQLKALADQARMASQYHSGDITGPGSLVCTHCGEVVHFQHTHAIPPCPQCNGETFKRWKKEQA